MVWNEANDHLGTLIVPPIQNLNEKAPFENSFTDTDSNDIAVFYTATMISEWMPKGRGCALTCVTL